MLSLDIYKLLSSNIEPLRVATHLYQIGRYRWALDEFERHPSIATSEEGQLLHAHLINALRSDDPQQEITLVWQVDPGTWETDWITKLFGRYCHSTLVDLNFSQTTAAMVVVCNQLDAQKCSYFESAFKAGARIMIVHLSDEAFKDDLSAYRWCDQVYRNYWSPLLAPIRSIRTFPLGYKSGIKPFGHQISASKRTYKWSFAGDVNKSNRLEMIAALEQVPSGHTHLTSGFSSADALSTEEYRDLLCQSAFTPCPSGWLNLETFRLWEALECGSIPLVEGREDFNYLQQLIGPNPIPIISSWSNASTLMRKYSPQHLDELQKECLDWWKIYKAELMNSIDVDIRHLR